MDTADTAPATRSFAVLGLTPETLRSLDEKGYTQPTEVQAETIPLALAGKDLVVQSRTGTGKTAAFGIPMVEKIDAARESVQALVLAPTRELALQVAQEVVEIGRGRGIKVLSVYGGDSMERQLDGIRGGAQVIAGTPGRVLDHLRRGTLDFSGVRYLVLDEADRMLDMGFAVEMGQIMEFVPARAADAALLGDGPDRHPRPDLPLHGRARVGAALRGPDLRQGGRAPVHADAARAQGSDALQADRVREPALLDDLLQHPRGDAARLDLPGQQGHGRGDALLRPAAEEARAGDGPLPRAGRSATW